MDTSGHKPLLAARTATLLIALLAVLGLVVVVQNANAHLPGNHQGYEPDQPVLFSHQVHAGDLQIHCLFCHPGAEKGRVAGIPSASLCLTCHKTVTAPLPLVNAEETLATAQGREKRTVFSPEIRKIYDALALGDDGKPIPGKTPTPIPWVRVHSLPDFVAFDHRSHVAAGVACQTCHGPVDAMHRIRQHTDLGMGWCVQCHRDSRAVGLADGRPSQASDDCGTCHH
jgi:hypothetical protein